MQDKDTEAIRDQRRRRKRIGRIKSAIVTVIAGWILLSMVLIICLFAKIVKLEKKIDTLVLASQGVEETGYYLNGNSVADGTEVMGAESSDTEEQRAWEPVTPPASGIPEEENLAGPEDVHNVYLTFDDGPSENTAAILDILAKYDVKATFFVTGKEDAVSRELYQRITEEGHTLGMHSYSNRYSVIYQSKDAFAKDYSTLKSYLRQVTGTECKYYRFPGGSSNQISNVSMDNFIHYLNEQGTIYYDWNVSAGDATATAYTPEEIVENVTADVVKYKTSVVLLHDAADKSATVEAVEPLILALQAMHAKILPIDEDTPVIQYVKADSVE